MAFLKGGSNQSGCHSCHYLKIIFFFFFFLNFFFRGAILRARWGAGAIARLKNESLS
jgi:hypothetical protein